MCQFVDTTFEPVDRLSPPVGVAKIAVARTHLVERVAKEAVFIGMQNVMQNSWHEYIAPPS